MKTGLWYIRFSTDAVRETCFRLSRHCRVIHQELNTFAQRKDKTAMLVSVCVKPGTAMTRIAYRKMLGVTFLKFGSSGKKHIERDTIVVLDLEKFNADPVVLHPPDGG